MAKQQEKTNELNFTHLKMQQMYITDVGNNKYGYSS